MFSFLSTDKKQKYPPLDTYSSFLARLSFPETLFSYLRALLQLQFCARLLRAVAEAALLLRPISDDEVSGNVLCGSHRVSCGAITVPADFVPAEAVQFVVTEYIFHRALRFSGYCGLMHVRTLSLFGTGGGYYYRCL